MFNVCFLKVFCNSVGDCKLVNESIVFGFFLYIISILEKIFKIKYCNGKNI